MKVKTKYGKEIEVSENSILEINGILGFEDYRKYILIDTDSPLKWLQNVDEPELAFVVVDSKDFFPDYNPELEREDLLTIGLEDLKNALILLIVSLPQGKPSGATVNLLGPIIINTREKRGAQFISNNPDHSVKEPLFPAGLKVEEHSQDNKKVGSA